MKPVTVVKRFFSRYLFGTNRASRMSLHLANSSETCLFSKSFSDDDIEDIKPGKSDSHAGAYAELIDEYVGVIKDHLDDDDDDDDVDGFILRATLEDGTMVSSPPIRPKSGKNVEKSLLAQCYRHLERALDVNHKMVDSVMKHGTNQMYHARQMHTEAYDVQHRLLKTEQDLADRSHERMLEAKKEEQSAEFRQAIMNGVTACFPMLAGKIAGIMPQGAEAVRASPHYQTLKSLFENIPPERWGEMNQWLQSVPLNSDAERTAFNHVVDSIMNDMVEAERQKNGSQKPPVRH